MRKFLISLLFLFLCSIPAHAWNAEVLTILDGDTIDVLRLDDGEKVRIRFYGVDAPEGPNSRWNAQPYSRKATQLVKELMPVGSKVAVIDMHMDRYDRTVAGLVTLPDGKVVQEELLQSGLAWVDKRYCKGCQQWKAIQAEAREKGRGLWRDNKPTPPWEWRKAKK